jgi:predicted TIM-barrel fold metal-dependent hydrolase
MNIDAAAYLGAWPFRANVEGTPARLLAMMKDTGVEQALVSPLPALFHLDPTPANEALLRQVRGRRGLWAVPVINPRLADAAAQVASLAGSEQVRGVRLAPKLQGYPPEQARAVVEMAAAHGLTAVIQLRMQDERSHPVAFQVPPVPLAEAAALAARVPEARLVVAAARTGEIENREMAARLRDLPNLWVDISHLDGLGCIRRAGAAVGAHRLLFATSWPFFYARSALLKTNDAELPPQDLAAIMGGNAVRAFALPAA